MHDVIAENSKKLVILGFGGHARSAADLALTSGYEDLLFVDQNAASGETFLGHPVVKDLVGVDASWRQAIAASGDSFQRHTQCDLIEKLGMSLVSVISPSATIGQGSLVSPGCFIGQHAHIGPLARIGRACIVNTAAVVEHECIVGDFSHISVNATMAGRSKLGSFSMLGAGGTIIDGISTVDGVTIGAGAVVVGSIETPGTYIGVPARRLR